MMSLANFPLSIQFLFFTLFFISSNAATFQIQNDCPYTVWAAASPGGGRRLDRGQSWTLQVAAGTAMARIWGRTNCNFDGSGRGHCQTGDCGVLECKGWGVPPNTLAEYALNQFGNKDFIDISLVDGFNIPMDFSPTTGSCGPTRFSKFFKQRCPDAYSYPQDDPTSTFTCPGGTNYRVVFCPRGSPSFPLEMVGSMSDE
uniref:Thaumatin-like protein n=1 Tax=Fagus sylvatica TaxID=28930 RepID=A0A2N9EQH6_FAGSY